jgi:hypothetical protein
MDKPSENERRIFSSLATESDLDTVEKIRLELTQGVELTADEIEEALQGLRDRGWVESDSGRWQLTPNGHGKKPSLLGRR